MSPLKQTLIEEMCVPNLQGVRTYSVAFHYLAWLQWELQLWADSRTDNKTRFEKGRFSESSFLPIKFIQIHPINTILVLLVMFYMPICV